MSLDQPRAARGSRGIHKWRARSYHPRARTHARAACLPATPSLLPPQPQLRIFFGSQTGTAENYAKQLRNAARKHGFACSLHDLATFGRGGAADARELLLGGGLALFLMATYGEGDPTDSAIDFAKWLRDETRDAAAPLAALRYAVFGLGNRQYQFFNGMGKVRHSLLRAGCAWGARARAPPPPPLPLPFPAPSCSSSTRGWQRSAARG